MVYRRCQRSRRTPLVPRRLARGVTERIDGFGQMVIPMYEHEVEQGIRELLVDEQVEQRSRAACASCRGSRPSAASRRARPAPRIG